MTANARVLWAWLWVVVCVAVIWGLSGDGFSGGQTGRVLKPFLQWLFPDITAREIWKAHFYLRKAAHVAEYAVLAVLSFRALRLTIDVPLSRVAGLALLIVLSVAGLDEFRQSFSAARTGSIQDVGINLMGGSLGVCAVIVLHRLFGVGAPAPKEGA